MEEEVAWRCQNVAGCPAQQTRRLEHFAQRKALDLEGLGGIVAEKLIERGLVSEPLDVFNLTLPELGALNLGTDEEPRVFGEKNAAKLIEAGGTTMDPEKRKTAYTAAIKRAMEQAYWMLLAGVVLMVTDLTSAGIVEAQLWQSSAPWLDSIRAAKPYWTLRSISAIPIVAGFILYAVGLTTGRRNEPAA